MKKGQKLGIYVQVPFCESKCSFCNFSSRVVPASAFRQYCEALKGEVQRLESIYHEAAIPAGLLSAPADTIYIGGGTPSLLGSGMLQETTRALRRAFRVDPAAEFTIELTPGAGDAALLLKAAKMGINRLSIGVQSFNDDELRAVGRLHSAQDAQDQVLLARRTGFANISLDLIAGLPHQTEESWRRTLDGALGLEPAHISIYLFEIDEHSRLGREVLNHGSRYHAEAVPNDDFMAWAYEDARERTAAAGYRQYEISNFARPGFESLHNRKYWRLEPYLGFGAGAHSFDGVRRWSNVVQVEEYENRLRAGKSPVAEVRVLSPEEQVEEFFFLGLRQRQGIDLREARRRWSAALLKSSEETLAQFLRDGWLEQAGSRVRLAPRGLLISNEIFQEFVAA